MSKKSKHKRGAPALDGDSLALMALVEGAHYADVETAARRLLAKHPNHHLATKALSFSLIGQARFEEALPLLDYALARWPRDSELHNNRGIVLSSLMRWDESLANFEESLRLAPDDPEVLKNLGLAYGRMRRWREAVVPLLKAVEKHPGDYVQAIEPLALALAHCGRLDEAAVCYAELWAGENDPKYLYDLFALAMHRCDWQEMGERLALLRERSHGFVDLLGTPLISFFAPGLTSEEQRRVSAAFVRDFIPAHFLVPDEAPIHVSGGAKRRLRIGYVSTDYRVHPVGFVLPLVIELHDRKQFDVFGYSIGADDGSEIRQRFVSAFDSFLDARDLSVGHLADRIRADGIDILVDLNGWTTDARPELFALRSAPIQVNWLGYAGTMGHPRLADYLIGDPVVTPFSEQGAYTETLVLLPHCYLPADTSVMLPQPPSRMEVGLPDEAFVYSSFNSAYKYNPAVFDLWCRILDKTPGSVLWLATPAHGGMERLWHEAEVRGIGRERIIFAKRVNDHADHLARLTLADLALDPFPYNSHSTGVEMLYAGVPMLSLLGQTFPGRVGASLLQSSGLAELIAPTPDQYCSLAVALYEDRWRLAALRTRLAQDVRDQLPLFNMDAFVANLEMLYEQMWRDLAAGERRPIDGRELAQAPGVRQ
ncbi:MAG: protein O-GlcNAc transferase [Pseudomonadota bacterium]|nr:protein O-GlcNAc transferase [Pseudomonadota bacterium]MDQ5906496.1 protein O-GlcNAc transferase [Pseudomonadota bacterium]